LYKKKVPVAITTALELVGRGHGGQRRCCHCHETPHVVLGSPTVAIFFFNDQQATDD
jgi:hypothetical protein